MDHCVIGILGASGGLGASTLVVALAQRAGRALGATACLDAHFRAGGLDVTACVEHLPGLRWTDLAGAQGAVDGPALLSGLPAEATMRVLAAGRGPAPGPRVVLAALAALRQACGLVVVDLPREGDLAPVLLAECDALVLVTGVSARQLADATALTRYLADLPRPQPGQGGGTPRLVVRGSRRSGDLPEEVAAHLDLPLAAVWPDDAHLAAEAARGRPPGCSDRGPLAALCDRLLFECLPEAAAGPSGDRVRGVR